MTQERIRINSSQASLQSLMAIRKSAGWSQEKGWSTLPCSQPTAGYIPQASTVALSAAEHIFTEERKYNYILKIHSTILIF